MAQLGAMATQESIVSELHGVKTGTSLELDTKSIVVYVYFFTLFISHFIHSSFLFPNLGIIALNIPWCWRCFLGSNPLPLVLLLLPGRLENPCPGMAMRRGQSIWGGVEAQFCQSLAGQGKVWVGNCELWDGNCKVWVENCEVWGGNEHKSTLISKNRRQGPSHLSRHCPWGQICGNFAAFYLQSLKPELLTPERPCLPPPPNWAGNHPRLCPGEVFRDVHPPEQLRFPRFAALPCGTMSEPGKFPSAPVPTDQSSSHRNCVCQIQVGSYLITSLSPGVTNHCLFLFFQVLSLD